MRPLSRKRLFVKALATLFLLFAVGALLASLHSAYTNHRFNRSAQRATATITEIGLDERVQGVPTYRHGARPMPVQEPIYHVRFTTRAGADVRSEIRTTEPPGRRSVGDSLTIYYDPGRPTNARLKRSGAPWNTLLGSLFLAGVLIGLRKQLLRMYTGE